MKEDWSDPEHRKTSKQPYEENQEGEKMVKSVTTIPARINKKDRYAH